MLAQAVLLALGAAGPQLASAQDWTQYYTVVHRADFEIDWGKFYQTAEAKTMAVRKELRHELDVPYGKDVKQHLDLYFPVQKTSNAPVLVFLHGGGFREGNTATWPRRSRSKASSRSSRAIASLPDSTIPISPRTRRRS
jgi:acetyl esterase/lipase